MLDQAFETLKTYDWGTDPNQLSAIDEAVVTSHGNAAALTELESRLCGVLGSGASRAAKDYACRKLMQIGGAASVAALAGLLSDETLSHMGRYALERIPAREAAVALREALAKAEGKQKLGIVSSLGVKGDAGSIASLAALLKGEPAVAAAAAAALGSIRSKEADQALASCQVSAPAVKVAVTDARLSCADRLLAEGQKEAALATYKALTGDDQPKHVKLAATRGVLACAKKG